MKSLLPILLAGLVGIAAGYILGRTSAPAPPPPAAEASETTFAPGGQEVATTKPGQPLEPIASSENPSPLTAATLQSELAAMDGGGLYGISSMRKWADLQERLKVSDLASIAAEMTSRTPSGGRETGLHLVLSTYAETDPQAAWNLAIGIKQPSMRQNAIMAVVSSLAQKDPARAIALADTVADPQIKRQVRSMAVASLAQKDPARALALVTESGSDPREGDFALSTIFYQWARKDPEAAKAAVARLSGKQAAQAQMSLVSALTQQDPEKAWAYASTLPSATRKNLSSDPRVQVIQNWSQSDPQAALKAALTISEDATRGTAIASAVNAWAGSDFSAALNYAIGVDDAGTRGDIFQNLSRNPNANRRELLDAVMEHMPPGDSYQQAVSSVLSAWAQENPAEAAQMAMDLPAGRAFSNVASQIASQWISSAKNKQEVFDWVKNLPEGEARKNSLRSVYNTWSAEDPQAALRSLSTLSPDDRKQALSSLASGWSRTSPQDVLQWSTSLTDAGERADVIRTAVSQWAGNSPDAAAKYVERLGTAERQGAMETLVNNWASRDTEAAAAWLDRQPSGPAKDPALRTLSRKIAQEDPEAALTWVTGITDEKDRLRQTESIARDWVRQDPVAARAWISTSKLPEETRKKLLK